MGRGGNGAEPVAGGSSMLSRVITVNRRRFCPETFTMCVKMVTTFQGVARQPSGEHQSPPGKQPALLFKTSTFPSTFAYIVLCIHLPT